MFMFDIKCPKWICVHHVVVIAWHHYLLPTPLPWCMLFVYWNWIHAFLYRSTRNWTMLTTTSSTSYKTVVFVDRTIQLWAVQDAAYQMSSIRMSTKWSDPSCTVCCIVTDSAVLVVCTLASMPVRYPDWLSCRMQSAWHANMVTPD